MMQAGSPAPLGATADEQGTDEGIFVHLDAGPNVELKKKFTDLRSESMLPSAASRVRRTWRLCRQPNLPTPTHFSRQHSERRSTLSNAYLAKVVEGVNFTNGEEIEQPDQLAA